MREHLLYATRLLRTHTVKPFIWITVIVLIGSFLRLYRFSDFIRIDGDHGRDMLIAKHIVEHNEGYWAAPYALGSRGIVKNSPVYYWILSAMWSISRSTTSMGIVFALTSVLAIIIGYTVGVIFGGVRIGVPFAFFLSVSSMLATDAHAVWPPHLLPLITVCALYCMARYLHTHQTKWLVIFTSVLFMGVHIHQSFLPFFGVGLSWAIWVGVRNPKQLVIFLATTIAHTMLWMYVTGNGAQALYGYYSLMTTSTNIFSIFVASVYRAVQSIMLLYAHTPAIVAYGYFILISIALALLFRTNIHKEKFISVLMLFIGMLSYGLYGNSGEISIRTYYFRAASVVFLFILSYCASELIHNRRLFIGFICITGVFLTIGNEQYLRKERGGNYYDHYQLTKHALHDYTQLTQDPTLGSLIFFTKYLSAPTESERYIWSAAPQWHLAEDILQKPIVSIPTGYNNFAPPEIQPNSIVYITCIDDLKKNRGVETDIRQRCINPLFATYKDRFTGHQESQQYTLYGENGDIYTTYRFTPISLQ